MKSEHKTGRDLSPKDKSRRTSRCVGAPFLGDTETDKLVSGCTRIQDLRTLHDILGQTEFYFLFRDSGILPKAMSALQVDLQTKQPTTYPYGHIHRWDMARDSKQLAVNAGRVPVKVSGDFLTRLRKPCANYAHASCRSRCLLLDKGCGGHPQEAGAGPLSTRC